MDVAIRLELNDGHLSVNAPDKAERSSVTKNILMIDLPAREPQHDYIQESLYFTVTNQQQAEEDLRNNSVKHEAILANPNVLAEDIGELKSLAQRKAIPFVLYTPKFDEAAKTRALKIGADEYHYGSITYAFLKRIEFIRKLKAYKNQRGNKPYTLPHAQDEEPVIKLWSLKRFFDILIAFFTLLFLSPIMILIAIIIKLESRGPVFYISKRAGAGYRIFNFYKFRSMRNGADDELKKLSHLNQYSENNPDGVFFKIKDDPRVTRFGKFIRNTSLDELPQLFNVLCGDMSLVGNRPLPLYEAEKLTKDQIAWRFLAPAGITGLWQVTKRGKDNMSPEERISLDMEYAMKNSLWLDLKILFATVPALFQKAKV